MHDIDKWKIFLGRERRDGTYEHARFEEATTFP